MKRLRLLLLLFITAPLLTIAQKHKIELINSGAIIDSAGVLYDSAHYKPALILLNKVSRSDTNYVRSIYQKALICEADSQYKEAIRLCVEGLALKQQREYEPDIYNTYGNTLNDMGEREKALKVFDAAIAKYPAYSLLYFNKGIVYLGMKKYDESEKWFKQALMINPYMYSAHFELGAVALFQGKLVPAFISFASYLLVSPEGRYHSNCIKYLSQISSNADAILEYKNARTIQPSANYQEIEDIIASKVALDKGYKPLTSIDDPISRQIQAVIEKVEYKPDVNDFWVQYYVPYYKKMYADGKFDPLIFHLFSGVDLPVIQTYMKKNKKLQEAFINGAADYLNTIRETRELFYARRDTVKKRYIFSEGKLVGRGALTPNGKSIMGDWKGYYSCGNLKSTGRYNDNGERTGEWTWYNISGGLKAKEHYENGKLEGIQDYYFINGNLSSHELQSAGQLNGVTTTYFYGGNVKAIGNYKAGKKDGNEKTYYANGNLFSESIYLNGELNGTVREYFKNGKLKEVDEYANGKLDGPYKLYKESGGLATEGQYIKDKAEGEWKYYHPNGKMRLKATYSNSKEDGLHEEYFESGQVSMSYTAKNNKITGEMTSYYKDGKPLEKATYTNGVISAAKYFDKSGREVSSLTSVNGVPSLVNYSTRGVKVSRVFYDNKGQLSGLDTIFYPSGKVKQINNYKDDEFNGPSVTYYQSGKKKYEMDMADGKENGYYISYFSNGKVESEGWMRDGESEGEWNFYNELGVLTNRSYYLDGELHGYKEEYRPDGKKAYETQYYNGWMEQLTQYAADGRTIAVDSFPKGSGKYLLRFPNGKVMAEANYKNGEFDGVYKSYYFDGHPQSSYYYNKGDMDSTYAYYTYGGKKEVEGHYKDNNKTGLWSYYSADGKLSYTVNYAMNMQNGVRKYYYPDGKKDYTSTYKDDVLQGPVQRFDPQGNLAYQINFEDDNAMSYSYLGKDGKMMPEIAIDVNNGALKTYYQNGKLSRECAYSDGIKHGTDKIYYANGQLRSVDNLVYEQREGTSKAYYENGKLMSEYNFITDNASGVCREYHQNGTLKTEITYENGVNNGPAKYYDENGKLTKTMMYDYGNLIAVTNEK